MKFVLLSLFYPVLLAFTNRIVNKCELFLAQATAENIFELILHLPNEVALIKWVAHFPEWYRFFVEGKPGEANENIAEE